MEFFKNFFNLNSILVINIDSDFNGKLEIKDHKEFPFFFINLK